jgi:prepilin-type N-terminal cleavage/methylation domain-containing protein
MPTADPIRSTRRSRHLRKRRNRGYTMLELVAAIAITGAVLVTTLTLTREGMELCRKADLADVMTLLATSRMEQESARAAVDFLTLDESGTFAAEGYPLVRWHAVHSDQSADGGITDRLMAISLTVWDDADNNGSLDATEPSTSFHTKVANMSDYQNELVRILQLLGL